MDASGKLHFLNDGEPIIDTVENPSYLCILGRSEGGARPAPLRAGGLCVVSEVREGKIQSYAVSRDRTRNEEKIQAKAIGTALETGGAYPCHIMSSSVGGDIECIMVSNYGEEEGILTIFRFDDGAISPHPVIITFGTGSNVNPNRQGMSHAHSTAVTKPLSSSSLILCCADLGSDVIVQFLMSTEKSNDEGDISLLCNERERISAPPGSGPRSLMFNPIFSDVAIVSLEMTAQVWVIQRNVENGSFVALGKPISLLPKNWPSEYDEENHFNHGRWASDAVWSPCGKFVYAAARLHNSVSVFHFSTVGASSKSMGFEPLTFVQRVSTYGLTPRCLCMSDCGKFIIVAHQHSHDISSFLRNESDGSIAFVDRLDVPNAACVKLIRPDDIGF